jgi:hypothetical protein
MQIKEESKKCKNYIIFQQHAKYYYPNVMILEKLSSKFGLVFFSFGIFFVTWQQKYFKKIGRKLPYFVREKMKFPYFDNNFQHVAKT